MQGEEWREYSLQVENNVNGVAFLQVMGVPSTWKGIEDGVHSAVLGTWLSLLSSPWGPYVGEWSRGASIFVVSISTVDEHGAPFLWHWRF